MATPEEKGCYLVVLPLDLLDAHPANREVFREPTEREVVDLADSIAKVGLVHALKVRPKPDGRYEVVSGHVRLAALKRLGKTEALCQVEELDDTLAKRQMLHANVYGRLPGPMDYMRAMLCDMELMGLAGERRGRPSSKIAAQDATIFHGETDAPENCGTRCHDFSGRAVEVLADAYGMSPKKAQEILRLNRLIPELQEFVETEKLDFKKASELALLSEETQGALFERLREKLNQYTVAEVRDLRKRLQELEKEKAASEREAASIQERLIEAEERVRELEREVESFRDRAASLEEDLAREIGEEYERRLRSELSKAEERVRETQDRLNEARARAQEYRGRLRELQQKFKELQSNPVEKVVYRPDPGLQKTVEEQKRRIAELEAELAQAKERPARAEDPERTRKLKEEVERLSKQVESLRSEREVLSWELERKRGQAAFLNAVRHVMGALRKEEPAIARIAKQTRLTNAVHIREMEEYQELLKRYLGYLTEVLGYGEDGVTVVVEGRVVS